MATEPTAAGQTVSEEAQGALTLHHGIVRRWSGQGALGAVRGVETGSALAGAERLMARLPGLATLTGNFGPEAWNLATAIAANPQLLQRFSLDARAMNLAELADIVQLVLEAETAGLEAEADGETPNAPSRRAASATRAQATKKSAKAGAAPGSLRKVTRPAGPAAGRTRTLATVRKLVAELRAAQAETGEPGERQRAGAPDTPAASPADAPSSLGAEPREGSALGSAGPGSVGSVRPALAEKGAFLPASLRSGRSAQRPNTAQQWLHPLASTMDVATRAPRALRLAEEAAELAFLQPPAATAEVSSDGPSEATRMPRASAPAPSVVADALPETRQISARTWTTAAGPRGAAPAAWARWVARGGEAGARQARAAEATAPASAAAAAATVARAAQAGVTPSRRAQTARAEAAAHAVEPTVQGASLAAQSARAPLAALTRSVAFAAQRLQRWQDVSRPLAATLRSRGDEVRSAQPQRASAPGRTAADAAPMKGRVSGSARPSATAAPRTADPFAALMGGPADAGTLSAWLPRWTAWLARTDRAQAGDPDASLSRSFAPSPGPGYAAATTGAGDLLLPTLAGEAGWPAFGTAEEGAAPLAGAARAAAGSQVARPVQSGQRVVTAGVPGWLAPPPRVAARAQSRAAAARLGAVGSVRADGAATPRLSDFVPPGTAPGVATSRSAAAGQAALSAAGFAGRLSLRHMAGLLPGAEAERWLPGSGAASVSLSPPSAQAEGPQWTAPAQRALRGELAAAAGAGSLLEAQAEGPGSALEAEEAARAARSSEATAPRMASRNPSRAAAAPVQLLKSLGLPSGPSAAVSVAGVRSAQRTAGLGAWTRAAAAAIERVVRQGDVAARLGLASGSASNAASMMDFAARSVLGPLAARPGGLRDALTPWLEQHLAARIARQPREMQVGAGGSHDLAQLHPDAAEAFEASPSASAEATRSTAVGAAPKSSTVLPKSTNPLAAPAARMAQLGAGLRDVREPAALRAALALFETGATPGSGAQTVARAFLARWFGQGAGAHVQAKVAAGGTARDSAAQEMVALRRGQAWTGASTAAPAAPREQPTEIVLTGLAALAALQQPVAERELEFQAQARAQRLAGGADAERTLLEPAAQQPAASEEGRGAMSAAVSPVSRRKSTAVQMHEFAPVGLRRGRGLLSQTRRSAGLLHVAPRSSSIGRVGYGASSLGGGEMLGLSGGESSDFFGEGGAMPAAAAGADRLGGLVQARRSARSGRGHAAAVAAAGGRGHLSMVQSPSPDGPGAIPGDFSYGGDNALVNPAAAMQAAVERSARDGGATSAGRAVQAGAMARVLSVTAEPSANVLPLVAPAAHALVAAAAAKPLSESIATSGSDPTASMPLLGQSSHHKNGGHDGHAQAAEHAEQAAQDLDALAMKIARQVMVRVKKERERRGLHG